MVFGKHGAKTMFVLQNKLETIARDIGNFGLISAIFTVVFLFNFAAFKVALCASEVSIKADIRLIMLRRY